MIAEAKVERERDRISHWCFAQEYLCEFVDANHRLCSTDLVISAMDYDAATWRLPALGAAA